MSASGQATKEEIPAGMAGYARQETSYRGQATQQVMPAIKGKHREALGQETPACGQATGQETPACEQETGQEASVAEPDPEGSETFGRIRSRTEINVSDPDSKLDLKKSVKRSLIFMLK